MEKIKLQDLSLSDLETVGKFFSQERANSFYSDYEGEIEKLENALSLVRIEIKRRINRIDFKI